MAQLIFVVLGLALMQTAVPQPPRQAREPTGCGSNIVSATVVATFCGHREGDAEVLDLFILWRGHPGWFQGRGSTGSRGQHTLPLSNQALGRSSEYKTYGEVTVGYDADFDGRTATVDDAVVALDKVNTILVDHVDVPESRHIVRQERLAARLPLVGDYNVFAIRRSPALVTFLQCEIPMPVQRSARGVPTQAPLVITVCDKLKAARR